MFARHFGRRALREVALGVSDFVMIAACLTAAAAITFAVPALIALSLWSETR